MEISTSTKTMVLIGLAIFLQLELVQKWLNFVCAVQLRLVVPKQCLAIYQS